jgi:hypothetical protein
MSEIAKVAETSRRGLEPVNPKLAGQYDQIIALLGSRLGADHAFLLAEPAPLGSAATGAADTAWYCKGSGTARPLAALPEAEASAARTRLAGLVGDIEALAEQMQSEGDASRELGSLLKDALVVPDAERVWVVDGRPVLVDWGNRLQSGGSVSGQGGTGLLTAIGGAGRPAGRTASRPADVEGRGPTDPGGPQPPVLLPPPRRREPRIWRLVAYASLWLVFAALTLASAARLHEACALGPIWPSGARNLIPSRCPVATPSRDVQAANVLAKSLDAQIRGHELALAAKASRCESDRRPPDRPVEAKPPRTVPPPVKEANKTDPTTPPPNPLNEGTKTGPVTLTPPTVVDPIKPGPDTQVGPVVVGPVAPAVVGPMAVGPVAVGPTIADVDQRVTAFPRGRVEVTLAWDGPADLDLRVTCPDKKEIYFREVAACGGRLVSKDLGVGGGASTSRQVEHITWAGQPDPTGAYTVRAQLYKRYSETRPDIPYTLVLRLDGKAVKEHAGQLSKDGQIETVFTFTSPLAR